MLPVAQEKGARNFGRGPLASKARVDLIAGDRGAGRELEGVVTRVGGKLDQPG